MLSRNLFNKLWKLLRLKELIKVKGCKLGVKVFLVICMVIF